jgi:hypothetical protein
MGGPEREHSRITTMTNVQDETRPQQLGTEVRDDIVKRMRAWLIGGAATLIALALAGWWFYFQPKIIFLVSGVPEGAVVAFDREDLPDGCPEGWSVFKEGRARVIVGSGYPASESGRLALGDDGKRLTAYGRLDSGGRESSSLTIEELPPHKHGTFVYKKSTLQGPVPDLGSELSGWAGVVEAETKSTGNGKSFTNMPPFVALTYCKKNRRQF